MFRVRWSRAALESLEAVWLQADSAGRAELTATTNLIDGLLSAAAPKTGESRGDQLRIVFVGRFSAVYQMESDGVTASVLQFGQVR